MSGISTDYDGSGIYVLLNTTKNKAYVGKSKHISERFREHRQNFKSKPEGFPMYDDDLSDFRFIVAMKLSEDEFSERGWLYEMLCMRECILLHFDLYNQYPKGRKDIDWTILSRLSHEMGVDSGISDSIRDATGVLPILLTMKKP